MENTPKSRPSGTASKRVLASYELLGIRVHAVQIPDVIAIIEDWVASKEQGRVIAVAGMNNIMEAYDDAAYHSILLGADLVVPDGMPLVWMARRRGHALRRRVYGPELLVEFCRLTGKRYRHFFYGGDIGVASRLASTLQARFGIEVAGYFAPPFRDLTPEEKDDVVANINAARCDVVWVGLGTPKQERWMAEFSPCLLAPVAIGVGAAFDFVTGTKVSAPRWMQENGLEWLFRLLTEPRRLWRRYVVNGPRFVYAVALEEWGRSHRRV